VVPALTDEAKSRNAKIFGLSQVHGFAHQSGGTVTIASELGRGTTVTIYLPRAVENPPVEAAPLQGLESAAGEAILIVEDNPDVAEVSVSMLRQLGYGACSSDAAAALKCIDERDFDLIISDIVMAGAMDGIGLARAICERKSALPVLLVTAYSHSAVAATEDFVIHAQTFPARRPQPGCWAHDRGCACPMLLRSLTSSRSSATKCSTEAGRSGPCWFKTATTMSCFHIRLPM